MGLKIGWWYIYWVEPQDTSVDKPVYTRLYYCQYYEVCRNTVERAVRYQSKSKYGVPYLVDRDASAANRLYTCSECTSALKRIRAQDSGTKRREDERKRRVPLEKWPWQHLKKQHPKR